MAYIEELGNNQHKIYVDMGYVRGRRVRRTKTVIATSDRDLRNKARDFEFECMQENKPIDNITFTGFVEKWMKNHVKENLKTSTLDTYKQILDTYLLDHFGKMKLKDIKRFHIVEFLTDEEKMKAEKHNVLKSIFKKAVEWEVIESNPTQNVKRPKRENKKVEYYNKDELNHLFNILENVYPKHRIMIKLAAIGGLRRAEIAGIREENINFEESYIYVDKQLRYSKGFYLSSLKNGKPRKVYFHKKFMKELKTYVTEFKSRRMEAGNAWNPLIINKKPVNLIIVKEDGYPAHVDSLTSEWNKIIKKYDLKDIKFHGLRHSCASLMVSEGTNFKIIQERLGHSNIGITLDTYSHIEKEKHVESTDAFSDLL